MLSNLDNRPTPGGNTEHTVTTANEGSSQNENSASQPGANDQLTAAEPVRLPERAYENTIRYRRCYDCDSW